MKERLRLTDECFVFRIDRNSNLGDFSCGDDDLDDFFHNEAALYSEQLLGKTYAFSLKSNPREIVSMFTVSNDSIKAALITKSACNRLQRPIPNAKRLRSYAAVLVGRLGVSEKYRNCGLGSQTLDYIKALFAHPENKSGCRFVVIDAYNKLEVLSFYEHNSFKFLYATEEEERNAFNLEGNERLHSRMMYFDLKTIV